MSTRIKRRDNYIYDEKYEDIWSELWLRPGAPRYVIDAVYRAMSRHFHPDLGEIDERGQQRLNDAYTHLKKLTEGV